MAKKTRKRTELRPTRIEPYPTAAAGSVMITQGNTRVLCTASLSMDVPRWIKLNEQGQPQHGWVTAEYAMLPGSTPDRKRRGPDSRGTEIQRIIGRALRAAVDLTRMPTLAVTVDCDVVVADGGTRTASITGGFVALAQALGVARERGLLAANPILSEVAAVSVGIVDGQTHLDLDYPLDARADVDLNVAMNGKGRFIEVQGAGEHGTFGRDQLDELLDLATKGVKQLIRVQRDAMASIRPSAASRGFPIL